MREDAAGAKGSRVARRPFEAVTLGCRGGQVRCDWRGAYGVVAGVLEERARGGAAHEPPLLRLGRRLPRLGLSRRLHRSREREREREREGGREGGREGERDSPVLGYLVDCTGRAAPRVSIACRVRISRYTYACFTSFRASVGPPCVPVSCPCLST